MGLSLGDDQYCIDIRHVDEIRDANEDVTNIPTADDHVVGLVDPRSEATTVVDPRVKLDEDGKTVGDRIVVVSLHDATGFLDDVHEVESVTAADLDDSAASETTRGVLRRDDRFVVWVTRTHLCNAAN